ncbi:tetratricopeptide repeat protein [Bermanella sp. WJH001]|uniref:tetratricopeptide repeat protein n=1 Tax=Bermanella sp. WJH001 TaxID=3048005 RepID=UPI0024BDD3CF|nr:tetratricopeptide repeat protein [Bermanella sp. WJH001]MDJ1539738.1 tetratricopeptide repeat protein [Bermanella sp. WJH001]
MKTILLPVLISISVLAGCSIEQFAMEKDPFVAQKPDKDVDPLTVDSAEYAKNNHGLVNIHRHGPGYDVMMMLNAGESDIIFSMDLPVGGETYMPEISEQMKAQREKGKAPDSIEEEKDFFNEKALSLFSDATKHMLSAQALFYRKSYWKALEETNKAMSLVPSSAQAHALKGSIYYKMGRKKDAKVSWQQALQLDPSLTDVKESLKLVK